MRKEKRRVDLRMVERVLEYIRRNDMIDSGDMVLAALSGGADSVCLLHVLYRLAACLGITLRAVHVHHGLRGREADRDAAWSEEFCRRLTIPCDVVRCDVRAFAGEHGMSLEEAGRSLRYETFDRLSRRYGANVTAVAHHSDDQAETILHNLFRGTGLKGLGGIAPVRGRIIRPLLCVSREEILEYLEAEGIGHCEDSTNGVDDYTRNKLRRQILPLIIDQINPAAAGNIARAGRLIAQADEYLERQAAAVIERACRAEKGRAAMEIRELSGLEEILRSYVILRMMKNICKTGKDITAAHVEQILSLLDKPVGRRLDLPYGLAAGRTYTELWIADKKELKNGEHESGAVLPDPVYEVFPYEKGLEIPKKKYTKWFDYDKIKGALSVRTRRTGDFFLLPSGGRKTLKSFMIDEKIPREERDRIPLLAEENHVIWIIGYRISEYYKITEDTQTILQVQVDGGKDSVR